MIQKEPYYQGIKHRISPDEFPAKYGLVIRKWNPGEHPNEKWFDIEYCIECDIPVVFEKWKCTICGCDSPRGSYDDFDIGPDNIDPLELLD